jgi:hypothetical protein
MSGMAEPARSTSVLGNGADEEARELQRHCRTIAKDVLEGMVVPVLGAGVNICERDPSREKWKPNENLPSSAELAAYLAEQSAYEPEFYRRTEQGAPSDDHEPAYDYEPVFDLVRVSQYVEVAKGSLPLHQALHDVFSMDYQPSIVHRFLARLAKVVSQPLLMLTTNYDDALERALREVRMSYDVVTYVTDYPERTRGYFTHSFWEPSDEGPEPDESEPTPIRAKTCVELLETRPAIVKIHGATRPKKTVDEDNYVITEDDYIDFLVHKDATRSLPVAVARRLPRSHFLFLGYALRDWNLRVLLRRIWSEQRRTAKSWSVRLDADEMEDHWWEKQGVSTLRHPLSRYILALRAACLGDFLDSFYPERHDEPQDAAADEPRKKLTETPIEALFQQLSVAEDSWKAISRGVPAKHVRAVLDDGISAKLPDALVQELRKRVHPQPASATRDD